LRLAATQGQPQAVEELRFVSAAMAPSERAIAESLVKESNAKAKNAP